MPRISVIVPVYKVEMYLGQCVDSILSQTFEDFELILVDDGSPDNSGTMCDEYAKKDSRVRVIHQENQGQAVARNKAVNSAKGQWVSFVDSDDIIHPQMLEILYSGTENDAVNMVLCDATEGTVFPGWNAQQTPIRYRLVRSDCEETLENWIENGRYRYWIPCTKLIAIDLLKQFPFPKGRIYEDNAVVFKWLHEAKRIADCDCVLYWYRKNPNSTMKNGYSIKRLDYLWAVAEHIEFYSTHHYERMRQRMCDEYFRMVISNYDMAVKRDDGDAIVRALRKNAKKLLKQHKHVLTLTAYEQERLYSILYPVKYRCQQWFRK